MKLDQQSPLLLKIILVFFFGFISSGIGQKATDSAWFYYYKALKPETPSDLSKAYVFYTKSADKNLNDGELFQAVQDLRMVSQVEMEMGFNNNSEESAVNALELLDKLPVDSLTNTARKGLYHHLGRVYRSLEAYDTALTYYNRSFELAMSVSDSTNIYNNMGNIYLDSKDYKMAEEKLGMAYQRSLMTSDSILIARTLDNLSFVQSKLGNPDGVNGMLQALELRELLEDYRGLYSSHSHLYEYGMSQKDTGWSKYHINEALKIAKKLNSASYLNDALTKKLILEGDPEISKYIRLSDSMYEARQNVKNGFAAMQYDFYKEKKRADEMKLLQLKERQKKTVFQIVGGLLIIMGLLGYVLLRNKHEKEKLEKVFETESMLSKRVHDEIANDVYHLMTKLQTGTDSKSEDVMDHLDAVYNKSRNISKAHASMEWEGPFETHLTGMLKGFNSGQVNVLTKNMSNIEWDKVSKNKKMVLYRVLQELMVNMKKHSGASLVVVSFEKLGAKTQIKYSDNGIGTELKKTGGLLNAENRIQGVDGTITFESSPNKGFKATINI
ncbi:hypothetical protein LRR18_12935 [Mangrovimonas sp. AS39]|uniref:tetratricopeptide repeat-containing sensor histidine kinase n=1 Tax=Mangrovimonas futianensis TaxID=2895523 RepID=UPI001E368041|nr:hypothetical protein [Mangrovimonas futianensis]MCF1192493.1 hypothetical protein [Mangrovimonas futianensis]MCF1196177.1 hypothetical protein [Mangrovimonas futianensis]